MAKALLLDRPSGTFVRVLVPQDLRACLGRRCLVRRLPPIDRDGARLIGACMLPKRIRLPPRSLKRGTR
jgi:hypothetical protein